MTHFHFRKVLVFSLSLAFVFLFCNSVSKYNTGRVATEVVRGRECKQPPIGPRPLIYNLSEGSGAGCLPVSFLFLLCVHCKWHSEVQNKNRLCSMTCGIDKNKNITKGENILKIKNVCTIFLRLSIEYPPFQVRD